MALKCTPPPGNVRRTICLGNNFRGVTTNKRGHLVQFESEQEHKLLLLLERDTTVADYMSQAEVLIFHDASGHQRTYTPDFKVWRTDGQIELHEVTIEARRAIRDTLSQREMAARSICLQRGWHYIVHTDQTLPAGYEYVNLDFLAAFRAQIHASPQIAHWWLTRLADCQPVQPRHVLAHAGADAPVNLLNGLYHLLWHGVIQMDWQLPFIWQSDFHPTARIWLAPASPSQAFTPAQASATSLGVRS